MYLILLSALYLTDKAKAVSLQAFEHFFLLNQTVFAHCSLSLSLTFKDFLNFRTHYAHFKTLSSTNLFDIVHDLQQIQIHA